MMCCRTGGDVCCCGSSFLCAGWFVLVLNRTCNVPLSRNRNAIQAGDLPWCIQSNNDFCQVCYHEQACTLVPDTIVTYLLCATVLRLWASPSYKFHCKTLNFSPDFVEVLWAYVSFFSESYFVRLAQYHTSTCDVRSTWSILRSYHVECRNTSTGSA